MCDPKLKTILKEHLSFREINPFLKPIGAFLLHIWGEILGVSGPIMKSFRSAFSFSRCRPGNQTFKLSKLPHQK
jgi:hypothetical protein